MMNGVIWTVSLGENTVKRGIQKWCWPLRSIRNWKPIKAILDSAEMRIKMKPWAKLQVKRYFHCCLSMIILMTFAWNRRFCTFVPFHKWRNKTFRQCSQMRTPWVSRKKIEFTWNIRRFFLAIDLMEKMLEVDSDKRINAAQTLSHPYLEEVCSSFFLMIM